MVRPYVNMLSWFGSFIVTKIKPNILAAYASFLWEIEDDSEEDEACRGQIEIQDVTGDGVPDTAAAGSRSDDPEENYKMMIEENPNNALLLRNYAQFLWRSKGDLQGAEEYYLQAILADPGGGEIMAQYATLEWEPHHDTICLRRMLMSSGNMKKKMRRTA